MARPKKAATPRTTWKVWVGIDSLGRPDLATVHVDESGCQELIEPLVCEEGDVLLVPREATLTLAPARPKGKR